MILISHRGNINGRNIEKENDPEQVWRALDLGYEVEIDIWCVKNNWFLGHDTPFYCIALQWIYDLGDKLWLHCKNEEALEFLNEPQKYFPWAPKLNYFWHQNDDYTLTSNGHVWVYPGKSLTYNSICVLPEQSPSPYETSKLKQCAGICSDVIERYKDL